MLWRTLATASNRSCFHFSPGYINRINNMNPESAEAINIALRDHQAAVHDWRFSGLAADLHTWAERMVVDFKIQSDGIPALLVERLRKCTGHYRKGRNGFGINDEIAIDESHIQTSPYWQVLGTLAHEILHFWQAHNGQTPGTNSRNYHNAQYRQKALEIGILVDRYGHTQFIPENTPFMDLLKKYGIEIPSIPAAEDTSPQKSPSSLRLYECSCGVKVRVGRMRFNAQCLDCGTVFLLRDNTLKTRNKDNKK